MPAVFGQSCPPRSSPRALPGQHWPTEGNTDETSEGSRLDAKNTPQGVIIASEFTQWLHIASTIWLTFYRVSPRRGSLLAEVTGVVVHDHWKPYYTMTGVLHALCNAHHLRELKALIEIEKEDWASKMQRLLRRACHATNLAREQGAPLKPGLTALIDRCYDSILANGLAFHEAQPALAKTRRR